MARDLYNVLTKPCDGVPVTAIITLQGKQFTDDFGPHAVHLHRIQ